MHTEMQIFIRMSHSKKFLKVGNYADDEGDDKAAGGGGGRLFGSDDEDDDMFFVPTTSLAKATPKAASTKSQSADKSMTSDPKAALR